jgi:hypothetical protein
MGFTKKEAVNWYENQSDVVRSKLQKDFGNNGIADRETKFFRWISKFKKVDKEKYTS